MATFDQLISRLDSDFRVRGEQFEHICVWYLQNAPRFRGAVKNVWFFPEWPGRWDDKDRGVDIIVETVDGEIWAVQAKCYKPQKAVTKRDMDAFLSESSRRGISRRILIMSTDYLAEDSKRTIKDQVVPVEVISLSDLQEERLDWPHDPDDLPRTYPTAPEPAVAPEPVAAPEPAVAPDHASVWYERGLAYYMKGEYDQAIRDYSEAIRLKPDYHLAWTTRGLAYDKKGEYAQAFSDYSEAIRLKPDFRQGWSYRGLAYGRQGDYAQAISDHTEAIGLEPDFHQSWLNRGLAYLQKGEYAQAISDYSEAIRLKPDNDWTWRARGQAHRSLGNTAEADADFKKAKELREEAS